MPEQYSRFARKVPKEVRIASESLSGQNDLRWAILIGLIEEGASPFSKLQDKLEVHQQSLSDALSALQRGGLVEKRAGDELGSRFSGNYAITNFGKTILDGFYEAAKPKFGSPQEIQEFETVPNFQGAWIQPYDVRDVKEKTNVASKKDLVSGQEAFGTKQIEHA